MGKRAVIVLFVLLAPARAQTYTQPTSMSVQSVAGFVEEPGTSVLQLVGSQPDRGKVTIDATHPQYPVVSDLQIQPIGDFSYNKNSPGGTGTAFFAVQSWSNLSYVSYGRWNQFPPKGPAVLGAYAAGSRQDFSWRPARGNAIYQGHAYYDVINGPSASGAGSASAVVDITANLNQKPPTITTFNLKLVFPSGVTIGLPSSTSVQVNTDGSYKIDLTGGGFTGTLLGEFYGPQAIQTVGTFSATSSQYRLAGAFYAQLPPPPLISGPNPPDLWWFNGEKPPGYDTEIFLTINGGGQGPGPFHWKITAGRTKVQFANNDWEIDTPTDIVTVKSIGGSAALNDVSVTVSLTGAAAVPFKLTVREPHEAIPIPNGIWDEPDPGDRGNPFDSHWWYISHLPYKVRDQFHKALGKDLPVREYFNGKGAIEQCSFCNWLRTDADSGLGHGGIIIDTIEGQSNQLQTLNGSKPDPLPLCPTGNCASDSLGNSELKVHCFTGGVRVGSQEEGKGVPIMTLTWERYQDHARHCNIVSPVDGSVVPLNPCTCR